MVKVSVITRSNRLGSIAAKLPGRSRALVAETVEAVTTGAKRAIEDLGAVDTGELLENVRGQMTGATEGEVISDTDHSLFVHEGTVHMAARPFMQIAAERERPIFAQKAATLVSDL